MGRLQEFVLQLPATLRSERLLTRLGARTQVSADKRRSLEIAFYDSCDRDLWFAGLALYTAGEELVATSLENLLTAAPLASCRWTVAVPKFSWELPDSAVRERIASMLKLRALLPLLRVIATSQTAEIKNKDDKTVVRLTLQAISSPQDEHQTMLELCYVRPVRGYELEASQLVVSLTELGLYQADSHAVARVVGELASVPDEHPAHLSLELDARQSSREAVCSLVGTLWAFARSRELGIVEDIDTEYLHEYRVALRRIRSLVALSKGVFPAVVTTELKDRFGQLARSTNRLRDLDVYLLAKPPYRKLLPEALRSGLEEMFADFAGQREQEQREVSERMSSDGYRGAVAELERWLDAAERSPATKTAGLPAVELARRVICKRYQKIVKQGNLIDCATADAAIHELRVECKKLRYALEFFASLFQDDAVAATIKRLKRLQDSLGTFNDLCVQQTSLADYLETKQQTGPVSVLLAASIGGLIGALHQRQIEQRSVVERQIAKFCSTGVATMFEGICQPTKRAA